MAIKAGKGKVLVQPIKEENKKAGIILIPEQFDAPYGRTRTGVPHKMGKVLDVGPETRTDVKKGDIVVIDGLNLNTIEVDRKEYYCPIPAAILFVVED